MEFMPKRGMVDAKFILRQMMEKYEVAKGTLYMVFEDYEKAFDRLPREVIWWVMSLKRVADREIKATTKMYMNIQTTVK